MEVHDIVQEAGIKTMPKKKKCKKAKWLPEESLQIAVKRREAKSKGKKERYTHLNPEFQRISRRDTKAFLVISAKKYVEFRSNRSEKQRNRVSSPRAGRDECSRRSNFSLLLPPL